MASESDPASSFSEAIAGWNVAAGHRPSFDAVVAQPKARPQLSESHPEHLVERAQSSPRSFGMESQQLLTQCQILQHEVFAGTKCTDKPADEVPKQRNHGKNLSGRPVSDFSPSSSFHWTAIIWRTTGSVP